MLEPTTACHVWCGARTHYCVPCLVWCSNPLLHHVCMEPTPWGRLWEMSVFSAASAQLHGDGTFNQWDIVAHAISHWIDHDPTFNQETNHGTRETNMPGWARKHQVLPKWSHSPLGAKLPAGSRCEALVGGWAGEALRETFEESDFVVFFCSPRLKFNKIWKRHTGGKNMLSFNFRTNSYFSSIFNPSNSISFSTVTVILLYINKLIFLYYIIYFI